MSRTMSSSRTSPPEAPLPLISLCREVFQLETVWDLDKALAISTEHRLLDLASIGIPLVDLGSSPLQSKWHFIVLFGLFPSMAYLLVSCLCFCMYTNEVKTHGARAQFPRRKQKGQGCEHVDISQAIMFNRFKGLAFPIGLCTLLSPLSSSLLSLLDKLY